MADTIQIKAGAGETKPDLAGREIAYATDEKALYIGTADGNLKLCQADDIEAVKKLKEDMKDKLKASQVAAQTEVAADADMPTLIAAHNALIAALKESGVMGT